MHNYSKRKLKILKKSNTKKNLKNQKNQKNQKNFKKIYSVKKLLKNSFLYASKSVNGKDLLDYTKKNEILMKEPCIIHNMSWFGSYKVAKSYQTHETHLYQWKIKQNSLLLTINSQNKGFFQSLFLNNTKVKLTPAIELSKEDIRKIILINNLSYLHPYVNMNLNERAYYEFCFVFGYISIVEQFKFMKFLKYLLEKKIITMETRSGQSILKKIFIKINYYRLSHLFYSNK